MMLMKKETTENKNDQVTLFCSNSVLTLFSILDDN